MKLENIVLPLSRQPTAQWDLDLDNGTIRHIQPTKSRAGQPCKILIPSLCHPHVHLDKPYILTCNNHPPTSNHPDYSDLLPKEGSFTEALQNTSKAKERYTSDDLYLRGAQLLASSYEFGVTALRAFVELDHVTGALSLTVAERLKRDFSHLLEVQICAFAQDPIFSTAHGDANRSIITNALTDFATSIDALGTTPYVEESREASMKNIEWAVTTAMKHHLHLDFHLDYNLTNPALSLSTSANAPLTLSVIQLLQKHDWRRVAAKSKTIVLGHCTQLSVLGDEELGQLAREIIESQLPIHFVGLPSSDLFMMGRPSTGQQGLPSQSRPRGTLQIPSMIKDLRLSACIGVNNVGNAFTPFGTGDPLQLACWGVGVYQAGTVSDAKILYGCVSWRAQEAIGLSIGIDLHSDLGEGSSVRSMLLIENKASIDLPGMVWGPGPMNISRRQRLGVKDIVWDPPPVILRSILR